MNWYRFQARDTHTLYGRGTAEEAHLYNEALNRGRKQADRYLSMEMTEQEVKALGWDAVLNLRAFILADALKQKDTARESGHPKRQQHRPQAGNTLFRQLDAGVEQLRRPLTDYLKHCSRLARGKVA